MKETIEKIKENYGRNRTEILLMCLFIIAGILLNGPEIAREASSHSAQSAGTGQEESGTLTAGETESESDSEAETQTETETETESMEELEQRLANALCVLGKDFRIPMTVTQSPVEKLYAGTDFAAWKLERAAELYAVLEDPDGEPGRESLSTLQTMMETAISEYSGEWSMYVKNLGTDESFVINDRPMKSASVMKLFIMGTVYKAIEAGELERSDELMSFIREMITYSDNEASNRLLYLLGEENYERGIAQVDEFIREYGFSDMTVEYNGFNDPATVMGTGNYNQVSAKDCGKLLEDIYRRAWVNRSVSNEIEDMLLAQNTRYKIPAGLPEGVLCGNKTGEMDTTENDAAIIYGENCDYILVVLSSDWGSKEQAIERIRGLSSMVYEFLN